MEFTGSNRDWSPKLFNPVAGGGGALVGISWLVPLFGAWFGWKLARSGDHPASAGKAIGFALLGLLIMPLVGFAAIKAGLPQQGLSTFAVFIVMAIVGGILAFRAWPGLGRTLFAYALAARIPVVIVMLVAMLGNWGTHYDVAPPNFPAMGVLSKWFMIGVLPQLTIWIWWTIAGGAVAGAIAGAIAARKPATA